MAEQLVKSPPFYNGEHMTLSQFREVYENVERIFTLTDATDLTSLGPSILTADGATEDGWLQSLKEFKPTLHGTSVPGLSIELDGTKYTGVSFFFKHGGNDAADKKWLGDVSFSNETDELEYEFHTDGRIKLVKRNANSPWIQFCWAHNMQAQELNEALVQIKEHLHSQKLGQLALS